MPISSLPDLKAIADQYGTPFYLYDFSFIKAQYEALKQMFMARKSIIAYALKANSNLSVIQQIAHCGGGADCVSLGEIKRAIKAGIKPYHIIFSGVGKQAHEIKEALELGILFLNIESEEELLWVENIASQMGKIARISIRVNPDIDAQTHPYISTGLSENKFGVSIDEAKKLYLYAHKSPSLNPIAIHFHIGSQITQLSPLNEAAHKIANLMRSLIALGLDIKFFDVGGGIGICYKDEEIFDLYAYAQMILGALQGIEATIICEPGRFIVGNSGYFVTSVLYQKYSEKGKRFVIVDGAMNDLVRPTLYNAYHALALYQDGTWIDTPNLVEKSIGTCDVVGPICESGDWLAKDVPLPSLKSQDLLIIKSAGAYGFSMASHYNTRPKPAEIAFNHEGQVWLIRERETLESLWKNEIAFLR